MCVREREREREIDREIGERERKTNNNQNWNRYTPHSEMKRAWQTCMTESKQAGVLSD